MFDSLVSFCLPFCSLFGFTAKCNVLLFASIGGLLTGKVAKVLQCNYERSSKDEDEDDDANEDDDEVNDKYDNEEKDCTAKNKHNSMIPQCSNTKIFIDPIGLLYT